MGIEIWKKCLSSLVYLSFSRTFSPLSFQGTFVSQISQKGLQRKTEKQDAQQGLQVLWIQVKEMMTFSQGCHQGHREVFRTEALSRKHVHNINIL